MPGNALWLFKAARRPRYLRENLQLLAAERGRVVEVTYNRTWVSPALQDDGAIVRGTPVTFLFTDRPYDRFVPVRSGEVLETAWDDLVLRLWVVLRNPAGPKGLEPAELAQRLRDRDPNGVPGARFVTPAPDDLEFASFYDDREAEGWRRAVDGILAMSRATEEHPYGRSVFFRPVGVRSDGELHVGRQVPLTPGKAASLELDFYNPHLSEEDLADLELRAHASEESLRVTAPARFPAEGQVSVSVEALGDDVASTLTLQIHPTPASHSSVMVRFPAPSDTVLARPAAGSAGGAAADEVLRLYDVVRRNGTFDAAGELNVLDAFERLIPGEPRLLERRAVLLAERGDEARAYDLLRRLDPALMGDDARFLLFRLLVRRGEAARAAQEALTLDLAAEGRFGRFLDELRELAPASLSEIVPSLVAELPTDLLPALMNQVAVRLESPEALTETAETLYAATGNADWAYDFLSERRDALHLGGTVVVKALWELAAAAGRGGEDPGLTGDVERHIGNLVEQGELDEARAKLHRASETLGRDARDRMHHRVADRLVEKRKPEEAALVLVELSRAALETGDIAVASQAVERAVGVWEAASCPQLPGAATLAGTRPGLGPRPDWLDEAVAAVRRAWEGVSELAEWRRDDEERRREALRARYLNRRILIAGGKRQPEWVERLRDLTGAEVDWAEHYRDDGDDLAAFAQRIRSRHYAVVVYVLQKSGHEVQDRLRPACKEAGVPWAATHTPGWRGLVAAVSKVVEQGWGETKAVRAPAAKPSLSRGEKGVGRSNGT